MEFSRDGKTIRCVISEEEIEELGYTIEDIISNGTRTQEFMNQIFEHPGSENVMEHIKDIVNGLLNTIPKQKWDEIKAIKENGNNIGEDESGNPPKIIILFAFEDLDILIRYAKQVQMDTVPFNQLYKLDDIYFLMVDMTDCEELEVKKLSALTDEYATDIFVGAEKRAFIYEHGKPILVERAIEQLKDI